MFWGANYIVVRELNFLLKEENVSLTQVLEADDILQECKGDNKALIQFLTKPEVLAELITLITEEPPKSVELASQYRHANIACEVLTSHLSTLSDRLSLDSAQMNRLCDFINKDPPLNPLLASYFSRTVEMLLERSPKQDWYLYHIVCLRMLDFFKSRRDFLPSLLRHLATSAIADTFKYFIRLDDLFNKIIMEWLEEHQFLECLIQIICGTYAAELPPAAHNHTTHAGDHPHNQEGEAASEAAREAVDEASEAAGEAGEAGEAGDEAAREAARARTAAVASANAAALLCDLIVNGCAPEGCSTRPRTSWVLVSRLQSEGGVRALLQGMFTSPPAARRHAIVNGCQVLLALLSQEPILAGECQAERTSVELGVAPHLPLLHQALLQQPSHDTHVGAVKGGVGLARVQVSALLAHLALSEVHEVPTTLLTLGTPGVLVEMFFQHPSNSFLHAQVHALVRHALANRAYRAHYARHLLVECDLLTRLMDAFEENEEKTESAARSAYMGHVILMLARVARALDPADPALGPQAPLPAALLQRWAAFLEDRLRPRLLQHDTPLGGYYPSENIYEEETMDSVLPAEYDFNDMTATATLDEVGEDINADDIHEIGAGGTVETPDFIADGLGLDDGEKMATAKNNFLELASQRFDEDMWDDTPEADLDLESSPRAALGDVLADVSPWECPSEGGCSGEGWAQFGESFPPPVDPFAPAAGDPTTGDPATGDPAPLPTDDFTPMWTYDSAQDNDAAEHMRGLRLEARSMDARAVQLASDLLSAMTPRDLASLTDVKEPPLQNAETSNNNLPQIDSNANTEITLPADTSAAKDSDEVKDAADVKVTPDNKITADTSDSTSKSALNDETVVKDLSENHDTSVIKNVEVKEAPEAKDSPKINEIPKVNDTCNVKDTPVNEAVSNVEKSSECNVSPVETTVPEVTSAEVKDVCSEVTDVCSEVTDSTESER